MYRYFLSLSPLGISMIWSVIWFSVCDSICFLLTPSNFWRLIFLSVKATKELLKEGRKDGR